MFPLSPAQLDILAKIIGEFLGLEAAVAQRRTDAEEQHARSLQTFMTEADEETLKAYEAWSEYHELNREPA